MISENIDTSQNTPSSLTVNESAGEGWDGIIKDISDEDLIGALEVVLGGCAEEGLEEQDFGYD